MLTLNNKFNTSGWLSHYPKRKHSSLEEKFWRGWCERGLAAEWVHLRLCLREKTEEGLSAQSDTQDSGLDPSQGLSAEAEGTAFRKGTADCSVHVDGG